MLSTAGVLLPNTKFLTAGDAGDLVKISLGLGAYPNIGS